MTRSKTPNNDHPKRWLQLLDQKQRARTNFTLAELAVFIEKEVLPEERAVWEDELKEISTE